MATSTPDRVSNATLGHRTLPSALQFGESIRIRNLYQRSNSFFINSTCIFLQYPYIDLQVTGQLADAIGDFASLVFLFGGICETAS